MCMCCTLTEKKKIILIKNFFELLQIRIVLTDDVIMTSQFVAITTKVQFFQFYHTMNL